MSMQDIFSPQTLTIGGSGRHEASTFIASPWPDRGVWLWCTTSYVAGDGQKEFGIREIEKLNSDGVLEREPFGGPGFGSWRSRIFVPRFMGVTVGARTYDGSIKGNLTLLLWA